MFGKRTANRGASTKASESKERLRRIAGYALGILPFAGMAFYREKLKHERKTRYLEKMREADANALKRIRNAKGLDELYRVVCEDIMRDMKLDNVRILRVENNGAERLVGKMWVSLDGEHPAAELSHEIRSGDGHISSICYFEKRTIHLRITPSGVEVYRIGNASGTDREALPLSEGEAGAILANARGPGISEKIAVPLLDRDVVIGVIVADNRSTGSPVDGRTIESLEYRALYASPVIKSIEETVTDTLTEIPNRRYYEAVGGRLFAAAKRAGKPLSLVVFDIDKFKEINDTYNHDMGDIALKHFARLVNERIRESDEFVRYGGEEFVLLLPETGLEEAKVIAEKLRMALDGMPAELNPHLLLKFTVSAGVASVWDEDERLGDVFKRADGALKRAKENGRNRVEAC